VAALPGLAMVVWLKSQIAACNNDKEEH
jgi:hypothetical protein